MSLRFNCFLKCYNDSPLRSHLYPINKEEKGNQVLRQILPIPDTVATCFHIDFNIDFNKKCSYKLFDD